jgi:tetratricopeptide (TPR) repeat protein
LSDSDAVTNYNLGNAYYRTSKFNEAENAFSSMLTNGASPSMTQAAWYNKGVALSKQGKLEESIEAYKMAVKMDPDDENARINLQKALSELTKKMPPPPPQKDEEKNKQQNKDQRKQPPQSKLTKKQVEQLLKALQQREQQVQQKMQQRQRTAGQQEKDW